MKRRRLNPRKTKRNSNEVYSVVVFILSNLIIEDDFVYIPCVPKFVHILSIINPLSTKSWKGLKNVRPRKSLRSE